MLEVQHPLQSVLRGHAVRQVPTPETSNAISTFEPLPLFFTTGTIWGMRDWKGQSVLRDRRPAVWISPAARSSAGHTSKPLRNVHMSTTSWGRKH